MITDHLLSLKRNISENKINLFFSLLLTCTLLGAQANELKLKVDKTRAYINGDERKGFFNLINEGNIPFVVAASIFNVSSDGGAGERSADFLISPPTVQVAPHKTATLSLVRISDSLPNDRESLRYLKLHILPGVLKRNSNKIGGSVNLFVNVFYRPEVLIDSEAVLNNCEKITVSQSGGEMLLENPTPYWFIFSKVQLDGKDLETGERALRIAPYGKLRLSGNVENGLQYSCRRETGMPTDTITK